MARQQTIHSLQIGRGLAALAVVIHHASAAVLSQFPEMPRAVYNVLHLGYFGIDYFFVLSGFIIAHVTREMQQNVAGAKKYALSRAIRIYLPYLPIGLSMLAVFVFIPDISRGVRGDIGAFGSLTLLPDLNPPALAVAWTLQHEMVFYLLFGICFFVLKSPRLIYLWAVVMVAGLYLELNRVGQTTIGIINIEFLFGVAACHLYHRDIGFKFRYALASGGALLFLGIVAAHYGVAEPTTQLPRLAGLGFALLVLGAAFIEREMDFCRARVLGFLGAASYAIYLVHGPAMSVLLRVSHYLPNWWLAGFVLCVGAVTAGILYHVIIEKPLVQRARRWAGL